MMESGQSADDDLIRSPQQAVYGNLSAFTVDPITTGCRGFGLDDDMDDDPAPEWWHFDNAMLPVLLAGGTLLLGLGGALAILHYYVYVRRRRAMVASRHLAAHLMNRNNSNLDAINELPCKLYQPPEELLEEGRRDGASAQPGENSATHDKEYALADPVSDAQDQKNKNSGETEDSSVLYCREESNCPICLEDFEAGQKQRVLPCGHVFHVTCVDEWLVAGIRSKNKTECPLCKQDPLPELPPVPALTPVLRNAAIAAPAQINSTDRSGALWLWLTSTGAGRSVHAGADAVAGVGSGSSSGADAGAGGAGEGEGGRDAL